MHTVKHDLRGKLWCGPAALSAITGLPTSAVRNAVQDLRHNVRPVQSLSGSEALRVLEHLGFGAHCLYSRDMYSTDFSTPTLVQFQRCWRNYLNEPYPVLVNITGHFVVLQDNAFLDSWTKVPVPFADAGARVRRKHVDSAWQIFYRPT
jgi:hypothetical protein